MSASITHSVAPRRVDFLARVSDVALEIVTVFGAAIRCAAAAEAGRVPSARDLNVIGINNTSPFGQRVGR